MKPVATEEPVERRDGEVAEVFVIDCVELAMLDQRLDIGHLDHRNTIFLEETGYPSDKAICVGYVGEYVVGMNDVRKHALCTKPFGEISGKEGAARLNAHPFPRLRQAHRRDRFQAP